MGCDRLLEKQEMDDGRVCTHFAVCAKCKPSFVDRLDLCSLTPQPRKNSTSPPHSSCAPSVSPLNCFSDGKIDDGKEVLNSSCTAAIYSLVPGVKEADSHLHG